MKEEKPLWNPYLAGFGLGLVLLASFVVTGRGLGASGAVSHAQAAVLHALNPTWAEFHPVIGKYFSPGVGAFDAWIVFVAIGVLVGGLLGAITGRRFRVETVRGPRSSRDARWILALVGGVISGIAAQIARGCTSGQALTGGAQLALGSWVFMFSVFGGAYALAYFVRKQWI
jgi:uncharacterized membrane protein YedE/YeeE